MEQNDEKRKLITQAALKRFSHFGIGKTTLQDIAEDVGLSKANVYYYFADKEAIIESAIESIVAEFKKEIQQKATRSKNATTSFIAFLKLRKDFLDRYFFLYSSDLTDLTNSPKRLAKYAKAITDFEAEHISELFEQGIKEREFVTIDAETTSELYLESIRGIACISQICSIENVRFDKSRIDEIHEKQMRLTSIFLNGISKNKIENNLFL